MNNRKLNKILICVIIGLVAVILAGTIFGLVKKSKNTPDNLIAEGKAENLLPPEETAETAYFELGTMRIIPDSKKIAEDAVSENPESEETDNKEDEEDFITTVMVVSPWLAYPTGDTVFYEEIARKQSLIKSIFRSYFSMRTKEEILSETEENITKALVKQINEKFSLGRIENIYFTDYLFLE